MPTPSERLRRYRLALLALVASVAVHAVVILGVPGRLSGPDDGSTSMTYTASLEEAPAVQLEAPPQASAKRAAPKAKPKPRRAPPSPPRPEEIVAQAPAAPEPPAVEAPSAVEAPPEAAPQPEALPQPAPDKVALAPPVAPPEKPPPEDFPKDAIPGNIKITYELTSSFADGRAVYEWERDGDEYVITGEAEAVGFFTLFLEGRILQESRGKVTKEGLRPQRFVEQRPNTRDEGLEFDWSGRKVTFERAGEKRIDELKDNTVDWLSMIFQLAHRPPKGEALEMRVYTQRRMYQFTLKVVGEEEIEIPIGKLRALHLRHLDEAKSEYIDVWLGVDQYYMPVKMRYPVARNRIMVEQTATNIRFK